MATKAITLGFNDNEMAKIDRFVVDQATENEGLQVPKTTIAKHALMSYIDRWYEKNGDR